VVGFNNGKLLGMVLDIVVMGGAVLVTVEGVILRE